MRCFQQRCQGPDIDGFKELIVVGLPYTDLYYNKMKGLNLPSWDLFEGAAKRVGGVELM